MDHQTRITDALSHEMSSMRGRIDLSDLRQRDPTSNTAPSTYEKVELKNSFQEGALQGAAQSMIDLKLKEIHNRMNTIEAENAEKTAKISALEAENNQIRGELRNMKPNREISITQPSEGSKRSLENRFEQLVKEVDQCFGELGRQLQRESSARQELTTKLNSSANGGPSVEIEEKISRIENSLKEHQKMLYSPGFRAGNFMKVSGDLDLSKLFGELDKLNGKCNNQNGRLDDFGTKLRKIDQIEEKFNSDLKMIRARTVTLAEDIENIVSNHDHKLANSEGLENRHEDLEINIQDNTQAERKFEERPKQLRSKSMILEQQMLAESLGELKDNVHVIENQLEEKQTDLNIFKDQQSRLKENLHENIRTLEQKLNDRIDNILSQPPKMSRTVSLGPDTGDIKKIKSDITGLEEKLEHFKASIKPLVNEFRTGNLMSPAMTALHDQLIQVKSETENLRKITGSNRQKSDATSHEVKIRLRTLQDEIERTQNRIDARNSMDTGDEIDVIISVDGKKSQSEPTRQKIINKKLDSLAELEKKQEHFEILVLKKFDELQRTSKNVQPVQQREEKIKQWEYKGEIEDMSSELSKIWKILGDFRIELKRKELIHEDPSNIGALASAINEQMKTGKKGGMKRTQSTDFDFSVDLGQRIEIVEKQINKLSTGKIWKAVEAVEDDQNEIDKRLALVERKLIEVEDQSDVRSTFSASSRKSEKRTKKLKEEVESLKHKTIILENMLTDLKHVNENFEESMKKAKSAATKGELKRLATEINEIKTKVMEPLTVKCSKMLVEMARKEDMKTMKNQLKSLTEQIEKISDGDTVNIESQLAKVDSSLRKELAKCLTQSDLEEVVDIATSARKSSANVRTELNNFTKRTKTRFEDFSQKVDEIQVKTNEELGNFFKKNTNLGIIKSIDEVRQYSSDLAEKIEIIEEALDEISSKNEELPSISRSSSKLSRLSNSERTVLNDVSPFLEELEGLKSQFADFKDSISKTYVSNLSFSEKSKNFDEAMATLDELKQMKEIFEHQSTSVRSTKENYSKAVNDVENLTKTVQVLNDLEKVFEKGVEEKFTRVFDRLCHIEETTMKKSVHDDVQEMMDIQRTVSQASQINEDSVRLMIRDYVDLEIDNIRNSLEVVKEEVKSQHNFKNSQKDEAGASFDINHDLIEAIEGGMREYINGKLDLYVTLAELETAVDARIERGGPPSVLTQSHDNDGAPSREQIVNAVEECVNKQTDQLVSLFVTKDKLLDLQRKIEKIAEKKEIMSEKTESLRSPSSTSTIMSYEVSDKLDSNVRDHIKSQMKHYITTSDMHGLIHEVQRLTESHKMLTDFKYDIHRQIKQDEKKISQLENALLDKSEQRLISSSIPMADPGISLKLAKLSEKIEDIEDSLKEISFMKSSSKNENLSNDLQDLKLDFLRLKKHDIFEKINSFVTINDIRGLVVELSTISKDFIEMKDCLKASELASANPATNTIIDSSEILGADRIDFNSLVIEKYSSYPRTDDVENMINIKIEEIWPIVDEIVVKSILEYKERFLSLSYHNSMNRFRTVQSHLRNIPTRACECLLMKKFKNLSPYWNRSSSLWKTPECSRLCRLHKPLLL